ncbi:MAG: DUF1361 domain-containing protein [Verrucomicrobiota bacterium]
MNVLKLLFRRETLAPMAALGLASAVSVGIVLLRVLFTKNLYYSFLIWNLFLAWLPLVFALLVRDTFQRTEAQTNRGGKFWLFSALWLLFLPNAYYIFTDLIHLTNRFHFNFWVDLTVILSCALTGLVLGFVSLFLMQSIVIQRRGLLMGWGFVAAIAGLSSFGIYLGRFLRLNSWDIVAKPGKLYEGISSFAMGQGQPHHFAFLALFAVFLFVGYVMLYALTHLPAGMQLAAPTNTSVSAPARA